MKKETATLKLQKLFPIIYTACHSNHVKKKTNEHNLSSKDASLLSHLEFEEFQTPVNLARHLNITQASLHELLANLERNEFIKTEINQDDERKKIVSLTDKGALAIKETSVLDFQKLLFIFEKMTENEIEIVVKGFELIVDKISNPIKKHQ